MEGAYNVRDLGGYVTTEGRSVKWGKAVRSGDLDKLTDNDLQYLNNFPIRTYIDFRDAAEAAMTPDKQPDSVVNTFHLPVDAGNLMQMHGLSFEKGEKLMEEINRILVTQSQGTYKEFFRIASDEQNLPLLFHCSAGKDRTGFAAALLLAALGVDRKTIMEDYMLSSDYLKEKYAEDIRAYPILEPLMTVRPSYLEAAFEVIDKEFGGIENYLKNQLNVDFEALKKIYTE